MIDTGIKWIPEIKDGWKITKVKRLFFLSKQKAYQKNPVVLSLARSGIKVRDVSKNEGQTAESYEEYNPVKINDFLLNTMDLYSGANCNVSEVEGVISPAYSNLRKKVELNPYYFDFYFKVQYWTMAMFAHGKGVSFDNRWTLNTEGLLNYEVPLPTIDEQNKIVAFLKDKLFKIDELINVENQTVEKLKEYKQSIITEAVTKGLDKTVPMKDSGVSSIGVIPQHWNVRKFKTLAVLCNGKEIEKDDGDVPVYGSGGVFKWTNRPLHIGESLLMGRKGTIDNPMLVNGAFWTVDTMFYTDRFIDVIGKFLYYCCKGVIDYGFYKSGSVLPSMTQTEINNIYLPYTNISEQQEIVDYLDKKCYKIDELISLKQEKIEKLNQYKKSLIYEYVTGKKQVT